MTVYAWLYVASVSTALVTVLFKNSEVVLTPRFKRNLVAGDLLPANFVLNHVAFNEIQRL